jgi:hypothetical protein
MVPNVIRMQPVAFLLDKRRDSQGGISDQNKYPIMIRKDPS